MENENYLQQRQSMMNYITRSITSGQISSTFPLQYNGLINYWKNVYKKYLTNVKFLALRKSGCPGDNVVMMPHNNGNYLRCLKLISEFVSFGADHKQNS